MDRSHGFGSMINDFRPLKTRSPFDSSFLRLILPFIITRWPVLQKVHDRGAKPLSLLVNTRFQILFHSPLGVLFTFPSRYLFAIGHQVVFSLRGWSPHVPTEFLVFRGTLLCRIFSLSSTGLLPSLVYLPRLFD